MYKTFIEMLKKETKVIQIIVCWTSIVDVSVTHWKIRRHDLNRWKRVVHCWPQHGHSAWICWAHDRSCKPHCMLYFGYKSHSMSMVVCWRCSWCPSHSQWQVVVVAVTLAVEWLHQSVVDRRCSLNWHLYSHVSEHAAPLLHNNRRHHRCCHHLPCKHGFAYPSADDNRCHPIKCYACAPNDLQIEK